MHLNTISWPQKILISWKSELTFLIWRNDKFDVLIRIIELIVGSTPVRQQALLHDRVNSISTEDSLILNLSSIVVFIEKLDNGSAWPDVEDLALVVELDLRDLQGLI
jgi:hypothetical protein